MLHIGRLRPGRALPGVRKPASSVRGTCIVVPHAALLAVPDAPPRFFAHWARSAPVPLAARACSPSQVQCCTLADRGPGAHSRVFGHRCFEHWKCMRASSITIDILSRRSTSFSACCLHSRAFASRLHRPLLDGIYNVARWQITGQARTPGRSPAAFIGPGNLHSRAACGTPCSSRRSASLLRPQGALGSGPTGAAMASPSQVQCCTLAVYGPGAHSRAFGYGFFASPGRRHGLT